jgi:hypothetical protein
VRARVLAVDAEARRLSLGLKASYLDGDNGEAGAAEEDRRPGGADLDAEAAEAGGARPSARSRARAARAGQVQACKRARSRKRPRRPRAPSQPPSASALPGAPRLRSCLARHLQRCHP